MIDREDRLGQIDTLLSAASTAPSDARIFYIARARALLSDVLEHASRAELAIASAEYSLAKGGGK